MTDREKKLEVLKRRDSIKSLQIIGNGETFIEILEATVNEFKDSLGVGVEINNTDELISELEKIDTLSKSVDNLKQQIADIKLPDSVKVDGLDGLLEALQTIANKKEIEFEKLDPKPFEDISKSIVDLTLKVEELAATPKAGQEPGDYIPMRRVMKVGNKLLYDDSFYTGGGGGGSTGGAVTQGTTPWAVGGDVANDAPDSGNPVKIGGIARTALPTAVANSDRIDAYFSKTGAQIVHSALREQLANQQTTITSSTAETTIVTADATYAQDLYGLVITNTSGTVCKVTIKDATSGTTRFVFQVPATDTRGFMLPTDAGHKQTAANNNWTATCGTSVAGIEITAMVNKRG